MTIEITPFSAVLKSNTNPLNTTKVASEFQKVRKYEKAIKKLLEGRDAAYFNDRFETETSSLVGDPNEVYLKTLAIRRKIESENYMVNTINSVFEVNWGRFAREPGSGVGNIEPSISAIESLKAGITPANIISYNAPGGSPEGRCAIATIYNTSIDPEMALNTSKIFGPENIALTNGATEALSVAINSIYKILPEPKAGSMKKASIILPSYYTLPLSVKSAGFEVIDLSKPKDVDFVRSYFPSLQDIKDTLPKESLLVLTLPNNPNGEDFSDNFLKGLFLWAKNNGVIIVIDQLFDSLYFSKNKSTPNPIKIGKETGSLDNIVFIYGFAKSTNVAGTRTGSIATTNSKIMKEINRSLLERRCTSNLTQTFFYQFEALAKIIDQEQGVKSIKAIKQRLEKNTGFNWLKGISLQTLDNWYIERKKWNEEVIKYYRNNLTVIQFCLDYFEKRGRTIIRSPDEAGYNTLVTIKSLGQNNGFDKIAKTALTTGIVPMNIQSFGLSNNISEDTFRLTYGGIRQEEIPQILARLLAFNEVYENRLGYLI
ncbi:MAG: 1-aminocyclopropane-1-carboxylate synthase-like protein 1 [Candidatus Roizmanbacteria bacterium GW2011_GWA2_35_19]|uniref:1-aminocyclopropane-1-carboxylate synthase-like protein 1 n=2 Tax=Candidatus Roizmaniibacteriota TaxID=1752723 RepID=A0A0G0BZ22_9BACT|nr:MAG: 1-aminocyclopropane-1-carboxylate synthase-like protein 1 [Candidatus Roizmanbacteria bacterium GW2011_GWC2_35_12]KKP74473.1 MAG: 1-aminocyclopropane-1-carboxylate synthase-like protein 1 [Candidatus Roizmanbacteria bacterium GW2011_GWA2_35_19]